MELESVIGDLIVGIEHVESTSVEGLSAKLCIDINSKNCPFPPFIVASYHYIKENL